MSKADFGGRKEVGGRFCSKFLKINKIGYFGYSMLYRGTNKVNKRYTKLLRGEILSK